MLQFASLTIAFISFALIYFLVNLILVLLRNYKAHKFFSTRSPKLPVLPNPSIFSGHIFKVTWPQKNWKIITELHEEYGPTFGFYMCEQPYVSTKDIDLLKLIEVDQSHKHINRSKFGLPFKEFNNSIFQVDDNDWRRVRRAVAPALTNHKVRSDEVSLDIKYILSKLEDSFKSKLEDSFVRTGEKSIVIDVNDWAERYTLATIFLITYKQDNLIDFNAEKDEWVTIMDDGARNVSNPLIVIAIMFPFLNSLISFLIQFHSVGKLQVKIIDYIIEATDINRKAREIHSKIQRRLSIETGAKERDFKELKRQGQFKRRLVDTIIDAYLDLKIGYDDFIGSTLFLLLAGYETTADTITCMIWHLALYPEIQEKLRKNIAEEGIDGEYLLWCIYEIIRIHPAVPLGTGRILSEDVTVNGLFLPKGCFVMSSTYSIHHDPSIWPDPDTFKPDRWRDKKDFHPAAFMGFGLGPRNCVGGKLAIHEIKLFMQMLLTSYRIEKCAETSDEYNFSSPGLVFTLLDKPIKVKLVALST